MVTGESLPGTAGVDWEREAELCHYLQTSLDWAYQRRQAGLPSSGGEWGEAFLRAFEELPPEAGGTLEMIYLAAHNTLATQARLAGGRPLARRVLADPRAFALSLATAMKDLGFQP